MSKVIMVVLAVAASVAAGEMTGRAKLIINFNGEKIFVYAGLLMFAQSSQAQENITVSGKIWNLEPGQYVAVVHEGWEKPSNCNYLAPTMEVDGRFFSLFYVTVGPSRFAEVWTSVRATLMPDKPRSIVHRTIGLYDVRRFNVENRRPTIHNAACGYIKLEAANSFETISQASEISRAMKKIKV